MLTTLRALPLRARREAIKKILATGDREAKRIAMLAANEIPGPDEAPANKKQNPVSTK
jgi:hypothetical protein